MGDVDGGGLEPIVQHAQLAAHDVAELRVEGAERFIHHEGGGLAYDGAAERHALPVARGEAGDRSVQEVLDAQDAGGLPTLRATSDGRMPTLRRG